MNCLINKSLKSLGISLSGTLAVYLLAMLNKIDVDMLTPIIVGAVIWMLNNAKLILKSYIENARKSNSA